jgi:hypothetical protein
VQGKGQKAKRIANSSSVVADGNIWQKVQGIRHRAQGIRQRKRLHPNDMGSCALPVRAFLLQISAKGFIGDAFRKARPTVLLCAVTHLFIFFLFDLMKFTLKTRFD